MQYGCKQIWFSTISLLFIKEQMNLRNERGAIETVLVIAGVIGVMAIGTLTVISQTSRQINHLESRVQSLQLESQLKLGLARPSICTCHLKDLTFDETAVTLPDIEFQKVSNGCDVDSPLNQAIARDQTIGMRVKISKILLSEIKKTNARSFSANFRIDLTRVEDGANLRSILIPISFAIDPTAGNMNARPVSGCYEGDTKYVSECPEGFALVGTPGTYGAFCIHSAPQAPLSQPGAAAFCEAITTERGRTTLCSPREWLTACHTRPNLRASPMRFEMTSSSTVEYVNSSYPIGQGYTNWIGNGSCDTVQPHRSSETAPFRCCVR